MAVKHGAADPLIIVVSGPGGVGKGTIVNALVERDPKLWLSRSWTTRGQRPGEADTAYVFTDRAQLRGNGSPTAGSWSGPKFLDNYYGTPIPDLDDGRDVVLEIEVDGASQVKQLRDDAILIFVLPPSRDEQQRRLRGRGDPEDKVDQRLRKALDEEPVGSEDRRPRGRQRRARAQTVDEMLAIIDRYRQAG